MIPPLGWPLGTRAQMFWLEEGLPLVAASRRAAADDALPGARAARRDAPYLAWGTPGGDQQEQWALHAFLRHVDLGLDLQAAIDAPEFHTDHLISSFFPRGFVRKSLTLESRFGSSTVADLAAARARRHARARVVARPRDRGRARAGRPAPRGREPARHAGLRGRPVDVMRVRDGPHAHVPWEDPLDDPGRARRATPASS